MSSGGPLRSEGRPDPAARRRFYLHLWALGAALTLLVIPGAFTIDEASYISTVMALRAGGVTLPGTADLPSSRALLYADPAPRVTGYDVPRPVPPRAPPLYAVAAWPFSFGGWRGMVTLNTLCFLAVLAMVFEALARRGRPREAWLAAGALALAGYLLEYAVGLWPHCLNVAACLGALLTAAAARERDRPALAALAGVLVGFAAGVRYQSILYGAGIGLALLRSAAGRRAVPAFLLGLALPLAASSAINHARYGSWNPLSKGRGYMARPGTALAPGAPRPALGSRLARFAGETVGTAFARVVDFSVRPDPPPIFFETLTFLRYQDATGAWLASGGGLRKALVQSAPWAGLGFVALLLAWRRGGEDLPGGGIRRDAALVVGVVVVGISSFGYLRHEGLCFNQRYFMDLLPLAAIGFGLGPAARLGGRGVLPLVFAGVAAAAALAGAGLTLPPEDALRQRLLLRGGPALAACGLAAWGWHAARGGVAAARTLALALGACVGWGAAVHVGDDLAASYLVRLTHFQKHQRARGAVPPGAAVVMGGGLRDAYGALWLDPGAGVLLDAGMDPEGVHRVIEALLARGDRVVVVPEAVGEDFLAAVEARYRVAPRGADGAPWRAAPAAEILEVRAR